MEERLFSAGRIDKLKKEQKKSESSFESRAEPIQTSYSDLPYRCNQSQSLETHEPNANFYRETLEISHLKVKQESSDDENECLDTIRRMKEMITDREEPVPVFRKNMKENVDFGNTRQKFEEFSTVQKQTPHYTESDAEIDFSLTVNNSEASSSLHERERPNHSGYFSGKFGREDDEYERIKKSLFEEVNRLQLHSIHDEEPSIQARTHEKAYEMIDESSIPNLRCVPTPSPATNKKPKKANADLERLRSQINGTKSSV
jgi:hypothetical protein